MFRLKEGTITSHGLFNVLTILLITKLFLGVPRTLAEEGGSAAWLLVLTSAAIAAFGILILTKLIKRFPGKNLVQIAEILWGSPGRILTCLILSLFFTAIATAAVREFAETMLTTVLPRTPISIVISIFVITMLLGAYNGIEVITRSSTLLLPFILAGIISLLLLSSNFINFSNLFPLLGTGLGQILYHSPGKSSIYTDIIFAGLITANISDRDKIPVTIWKAFIFSVALTILIELFYLAVLRLSAAEKLYIPLYQLARIIYLGRFVQRIEAIYILIWFFTEALNLTLALYAAVVSLSWGFKIPIYQPLLFPWCLLIFSTSLIPADMVTAVALDIRVLREYSAIFIWGLPMALLATALLRRKGGLNEKKQET